MRTFILCTLTFFATLSIWFLGRPYMRFADPYMHSVTEAICCDIDVQLQGATAVSEADVSRLLPLERSIVWWLFHKDDIRAALHQHPFIESAEFASSGVMPWGQFAIAITERSPSYIAVLPDKKLWLVSEKGELVRLFADSTLDRESLPLVKGLVPSRHVDERKVLRRALYVQEFIAAVAKTELPQLRGISLFGNGDLRVFFTGLTFPVTFGSFEEDIQRASLELVRFQKILDTLEDRDSVVSLDLAFEQTAVIKRKDDPEKSQS